MSEPGASRGVDPLLEIMRQLRDPQTGCPWDRQQDFRSLIPYTLEEAYEVAEAIEQGDMSGLRSELGDLLFQIVFYAQLAKEQGEFDFQQVVDAICEKMVHRHPHVFADTQVRDAEEQSRHWEQIKQEEKGSQGQKQVLDDIPRNLPALSQAQKLQSRTRRLGFDWPDASGPLAKLDEELAELKQALQSQQQTQIEEEMGDLLFTCVNLCRHLELDSESMLRQANRKFSSRFHKMLNLLEKEQLSMTELSLDETEHYWKRCKY